MYPLGKTLLLPRPLDGFPTKQVRPDMYSFPNTLPLSDGLVFYADFGDPDCFPGYGAGAFTDLSPSRITGTNNGGFSYVQSNINYLRLTGGQRYSTSLIGFPYGSSLRVTVSAWAMFNTNSGNQCIFIYGSTVTGLAQGLGSSGTSFQYLGGGTLFLNGGTMLPNVWYHIAGSYDGTTYRLYVNGEQVAANNSPGNGASQAAALIGNNLNLTALFQGNINEIRVYRRNLSDSEILQLYSQKAPFFGLI